MNLCWKTTHATLSLDTLPSFSLLVLSTLQSAAHGRVDEVVVSGAVQEVHRGRLSVRKVVVVQRAGGPIE
eukprot:1555570-Rhodomonas_salina.1